MSLPKNVQEWYQSFLFSAIEFKAMKRCFEDLTKAQGYAREMQAMQKLNQTAQLYLDYKEPKGDSVKEAKLSAYAKRRLDFVRDVPDYTSAALHRNNQECVVISELKTLGTLKLRRSSSPGVQASAPIAESKKKNVSARSMH